MMQDFITWEFLGTFGGSAIAVTALTQIVKRYISIDPKWIALILALIVTIGAQVVNGELMLVSFIMSALNALLVAGASVGTFEAVKEFGRKNGEWK